MRVAFVQNVWFDLLGTLILAEILERQGHEVRFFLEDRTWARRLAEWSPQVVALTTTTGNHLPVLEMAEKARSIVKPRPVVILGGPHATFFPEVIHHPGLDAVCRGEGDLALPRFLEEMKGRRLPEEAPNFWIKKDGVILKNEIGPLVTNLDDIPFPRRTPLYSEYKFRRNFPVKATVSSRGCPFGCIYCYNNVYRKLVKGKGPYVRRRSVSHLMEELLYLHRTYGFRSLEILDDIFTMDKEWTLDFAKEYARKIRLPYAILSSPGYLDVEIVEALKESNCQWIAFGIENGDEAIRKTILKKPFVNDDYREVARIIQKAGIRIQTFNMVGFPGETLEKAMETVRLNQEIRADYAWCSVMQPYPGTELAEICMKEGLLREQDLEWGGIPAKSMYDQSMIQNKEVDSLSNLQKLFPLVVWFPSLEPLFRLMIRLPPNPLFRYLHHAVLGWQIKRRGHIGFLDALRIYRRFARHY